MVLYIWRVSESHSVAPPIGWAYPTDWYFLCTCKF